MKKIYFEAGIEKSKDGTITIVASDETLDRHGDSLNVDKWDLRFFKRNPILLTDHDHMVENIVGKATKIKIEKATKRRLTFQPLFHELTEKAIVVKKMVEDGFINTVSVGFIPHFEEVDGKFQMTKLELIEISFVTVPANPSAEIQREFRNLIEAENEEVQDPILLKKGIQDFFKGDEHGLISDEELLEDETDKEDDELEEGLAGHRGLEIDNLEIVTITRSYFEELKKRSVPHKKYAKELGRNRTEDIAVKHLKAMASTISEALRNVKESKIK